MFFKAMRKNLGIPWLLLLGSVTLCPGCSSEPDVAESESGDLLAEEEAVQDEIAPGGEQEEEAQAERQIGAWAFALAAHEDTATSISSEAFPHDRHVGVACRTCHERAVGHSTHTRIDCAECHRVAPTAEDSPVTATGDATAPNCLSCHHDPAQGLACARCHDPASAGPLVVAQRFGFSDVGATHERPTPFDHGIHTDLGCRTCHERPVAFAVERGCASCHSDHHQSEANCSSCHPPTILDAHEGFDHQGCSGAGCHGSRAMETLEAAGAVASPEGRRECLVCHQDRGDHEPDRACAPCHLLSTALIETGSSPGGAVGSAQSPWETRR